MGCLNFFSYLFCPRKYQKLVIIREQNDSFRDELAEIFKESEIFYEIEIDD